MEEDRWMDDVFDEGQWLVEHRASLDRGEAEWLERLAEFDREGIWALDGHFCCATWLVWRTNMKRSTAFEKLRVAHELTRRPIVADAFRRGDISYSATRAITRMVKPDSEVDTAMVRLAASGNAAIIDVERAVRHYMLNREQEQPPPEDPKWIRDVRIKRGDDGTGRVVLTLSDLEIEEFAAVLQAFIDLRYRPEPVDESSGVDNGWPDRGVQAVDESSGVDNGWPDRGVQAVDESSGVDNGRPDRGVQAVDESSPEDPGHSGPIDEAPLEEASRPAQKANAFMDMVNCALSAADHGHAAGDDRYMVHIVTRDLGHSYTLLDGTPLHPYDAAVACDASTVTHAVGADGEPLHLGRKTREWSTAQRRAISVRDGGHCRFPGCQFTHYDIHHMQSWEDGGPTDVDNGFCQCRRHHRLLHGGYQVEGDPHGQLTFYRPDGTYIGSTHPATARQLTRV
jgi:Domain of unknown function (DUF222)